jgi:hypothetical protein
MQKGYASTAPIGSSRVVRDGRGTNRRPGWAFGFQYASGPTNAADFGVYAGVARTEGRIEARASAAGIGLAAYRKSLRTRFEQRLGEMRRFESGGSG